MLMFISKIVGSADNRETSPSIGTKWDENSYFNTVSDLSPVGINAITEIYQFTKSYAVGIGWGGASLLAVSLVSLESAERKSQSLQCIMSSYLSILAI